MRPCSTLGCTNTIPNEDYLCPTCFEWEHANMRALNAHNKAFSIPIPSKACADPVKAHIPVNTCVDANTSWVGKPSNPQNLASKYPKYYKDVRNIEDLDVYTVHSLFNIQDPSGCIQHASKKLLLSGVRTGGKSMFKDISEARDTLTRWLQLNPEQSP